MSILLHIMQTHRGCHTLSAAQNEHCRCKAGRQVALLTTQQP